VQFVITSVIEEPRYFVVNDEALDLLYIPNSPDNIRPSIIPAEPI
jgi:hypothetical protein